MRVRAIAVCIVYFTPKLEGNENKNEDKIARLEAKCIQLFKKKKQQK